ncbi:TetR/AcrR family transcriptional regulator [Alteribacter aurantiacus]|uniref:TetR/AcrR family transcriptional regulator n=1 Tax=Alteribacter aurantiacus TaxID=254410 RepID=UPI00041367BA|nr:TetR/AcrR family transcriptional regulator [Alteribacter aurantiacus]
MPPKTVEKIKLESLRLFAEEGYDGASLSKITDKVGIRKSSLYNHFSNKEDLFLTLVDDVYERYVSEVKETVHQQPNDSYVEKKLYQALIITTDFLRKEAVGKFYMHFLLFPPGDLKAFVHERFLRFEEELNHVFLPIITDGMKNGEMKSGNPTHVLDAFYCLMDGMSAQMFYYDKKTVDQKREHAWRVFWNGIKSESNDEM